MDQSLLNLIARYQQDTRGISHEYRLINVCIWCPSENVKLIGKVAWYVCLECNEDWYWNHCWNCNALIDSREPSASRCDVCHWYICNCGACMENGCGGYISRRKRQEMLEQSNIDSDWLGNMDFLHREIVMRNLDMLDD